MPNDHQVNMVNRYHSLYSTVQIIGLGEGRSFRQAKFKLVLKIRESIKHQPQLKILNPLHSLSDVIRRLLQSNLIYCLIITCHLLSNTFA